MKRQIVPVENNYEKSQTYRKMLAKHSKAINNGFYFEAAMIEYAMIEDRLIAFLYHSGAINNRMAKPKIGSEKTRGLIQCMVDVCFEGKIKNLGITSISGKINIVYALLKCGCFDDCLIDNNYTVALKSVYSARLNVQNFIMVLDDLREWCNCRNEVVHAMLNKNVVDLSEKAKLLANQGIAFARYIDNCVGAIKKGNKIRKAANLPIK